MSPDLLRIFELFSSPSLRASQHSLINFSKGQALQNSTTLLKEFKYIYLFRRCARAEATIILQKKMWNAAKIEKQLHRHFEKSRFRLTKKVFRFTTVYLSRPLSLGYVYFKNILY